MSSHPRLTLCSISRFQRTASCGGRWKPNGGGGIVQWCSSPSTRCSSPSWPNKSTRSPKQARSTWSPSSWGSPSGRRTAPTRRTAPIRRSPGTWSPFRRRYHHTRGATTSGHYGTSESRAVPRCTTSRSSAPSRPTKPATTEYTTADSHTPPDNDYSSCPGITTPRIGSLSCI